MLFWDGKNHPRRRSFFWEEIGHPKNKKPYFFLGIRFKEWPNEEPLQIKLYDSCFEIFLVFFLYFIKV